MSRAIHNFINYPARESSPASQILGSIRITAAQSIRIYRFAYVYLSVIKRHHPLLRSPRVPASCARERITGERKNVSDRSLAMGVIVEVIDQACARVIPVTRQQSVGTVSH